MIDAICGMNYLFQMKQKSVTIKYKFNSFGHNFKDMTKEELEAKVAKQLSIINDANDKICSCVNDYIESLPYKVGDKVSCSRCDVCWITSIVPKRYYSGYNGEIDVRTLLRKMALAPIESLYYGLWKLIVSRRLINHPAKDINR